jgi:hypothetical protein
VADPDDDSAPPRPRSYGRIWPKLLLSGLVGMTVVGGIALRLLSQ